MTHRKKYDGAKLKIAEFVLKEIDDEEFTEAEIAKMLSELSHMYLVHATREEGE